MRIYIHRLLLILVISHSASVHAQKLNAEEEIEQISLYKQLSKTVEDSTRLRLLIALGVQTNIKRIAYWDSIKEKANVHHLDLYKGIALYKLGYFYYNSSQRQVEKSITYLKESLFLFEKTKNTNWLLESLSLLTHINLYNPNFKIALTYAYKGLKLSEASLDTNRIAFFNSKLGLIYFFIKDPARALKYDLLALSLYEQINDNKAIADVLCDMSMNFQSLHDSVRSVLYALKTTKYIPFLDDMPLQVNVYNTLGAAYILKHQYDSAEYYFQKTYRLALLNKKIKWQASCLKLLAEVSFFKGNYAEAKSRATECLALCRSDGFIAQIPELALLLKRIDIKNNDFRAALEDYELFVSSKDSISNEQSRKLGAQKEFDYKLEKKENENKLLAQQNQIQFLEIKQNNYFLWGMMALMFLVLIIVYLIFRQNKTKSEQQQEQLEQKLLRSQMNPHFIFNSLQAIQNFILKNDKKEAVSYLSSFANMTRNVLENSRMDSIPLKKEVSLLENYLQLQKLRFRDRFTYEILIDEAIDVENTSIPPMLAQPFIENSVEHGFHDIQDTGKITISYAIKNDDLVMEISDNGLGMNTKNLINKQHKSLALEITNERIASLNKKAKKKIIFSMGETFPLNKVRKGVKIVFCLPLYSKSPY